VSPALTPPENPAAPESPDKAASPERPASPDEPAPRATSAAPARRAVKVLHLRIRGDLDSARVARDVAAELGRADETGVTHLVLELDGNRWRGDVVWGIAQAVRAVGVPTGVLLADGRDGRVGTGQAVLGLLASTTSAGAGAGGMWVGPRTAIALEPGDDLRATAPDDTDWERIDRELGGAAWVALKGRGADTELATALLAPDATLWAVPPAGPGEGAYRLTSARPVGAAAGRARRVVSVLPGMRGAGAAAGARVDLPAEAALHLSLVQGRAAGVGEVLALCGVGGGAARVDREVRSGLEGARRQVEQNAARLASVVEGADRTLRDLPRPSEADYEQRRRRAGRAAIPLLEGGQALLEQTERIIGEYPELLRETPPGKTPVGQDPRLARQTWRLTFQQSRDDVARLLARAREYARE
jgi:hypothetical protein